MTREEAISLLTQVNKILVNSNSWLENTHEPLNMAFDMAIKALEQEPRWIPASERLPEKTGIYLISIGDLVASKSFDGHNFRTESAVRFSPDAWMPLPEPFEPQESEEE